MFVTPSANLRHMVAGALFDSESLFTLSNGCTECRPQKIARETEAHTGWPDPVSRSHPAPLLRTERKASTVCLCVPCLARHLSPPWQRSQLPRGEGHRCPFFGISDCLRIMHSTITEFSTKSCSTIGSDLAVHFSTNATCHGFRLAKWKAISMMPVEHMVSEVLWWWVLVVRQTLVMVYVETCRRL